MRKIPSIIVSGASGFIGRHFLEAAKDTYLIFALARRSQKESGVAPHPNIKWIQVDIADGPVLGKIMQKVRDFGGADFVLHLAAFYDYDYGDHEEYGRTNVQGTRHMLEQARWLSVRRFIFASSLAACRFPSSGNRITEQTPAHADFAYARSKRKGEEMLHEFSKWFSCSIVRFAAVFSDWCEYPPLYQFLSTWLSHRWNARILGGSGESAVPYIHVHDVVRLLLSLLEKSHSLPALDTYHASPDDSLSHRDLFETATRYYFGKASQPRFLSRWLAYPGVLARDLIGRALRKRPFERLWMLQYLDRSLDVNASYTRERLSWEPTERYHLLRRLLFLIENMKGRCEEWRSRNEAAMERGTERPLLRIYEALASLQRQLVADMTARLLIHKEASALKNHPLKPEDLEWQIGLVYRLLMAAVRTGDRTLVLEHACDLALRWFHKGCRASQLTYVLQTMNGMIVERLVARPELAHLDQEVHDRVTLTLQLTSDGIEDYFETLSLQRRSSRPSLDKLTHAAPAKKDLETMIAQLEAFQQR